MKDNELKLWNGFRISSNEKDFLSYIDIELKNTIEWFCEYYKKEDVISKFINKDNPKNLVDNIKKISVVSFFRPQGTSADRAWGYIYTNNLYTVYLNVYNFFNGRINASIVDTIIHEVGHLIDFQLRRLGERPSYLEPSILRSIPSDDYIISREEDYARIQRLRVLLDLSPLADVSEISDSLKKLVESKKMILEEFNIDLIDIKMVVYLNKPIRILTLRELSSIFGNLIINDYLATDIGYLFAKYSKVEDGKIVVDLEKISKINKLFVNNDKGFSNFG
jgi:hypothetical protein